MIDIVFPSLRKLKAVTSICCWSSQIWVCRVADGKCSEGECFPGSWNFQKYAHFLPRGSRDFVYIFRTVSTVCRNRYIPCFYFGLVRQRTLRCRDLSSVCYCFHLPWVKPYLDACLHWALKACRTTWGAWRNGDGVCLLSRRLRILVLSWLFWFFFGFGGYVDMVWIGRMWLFWFVLLLEVTQFRIFWTCRSNSIPARYFTHFRWRTFFNDRHCFSILP